ncbi:MAG: internal scaffolding protein [Microvirus sp.]|nr:MAG: internal scaffolding protein [Microvirus sp.]
MSDETALVCEDPSLTQQQFADEANINTLVKRFGLDNQPMPEAPFNPGHYGDFSDMPDLRTALERVNDAKNRFMDLPPELRARFHNSPGELWSFVNDPINADASVSLGLLKRVEPLQPETPAPEGAS